MVYCGKPSRGCQICRARKIKCDEARPTCSQCRKSNRACPGYRNALDLMFRNESDAVVQRAQARGRSQRGGVETARSSQGSSAMQTPFVTPLPSRPVTPSLEDRARTFFFRTYVAADGCPGGPPRGHLEYLPALYSQSGLPTDKLGDGAGTMHMALMAVGLAGLAMASGAPGVLEEARATYGKALIATNRDLRDPVMVKKDQTLMAILMLGIYENVVCTNTRSMKYWKAHIEGAAELLKIRGPEQFKSSVGLRLFFQLRRQIILACISTKEFVPHPLAAWAAMAEKYQPPNEHPANKHTEIMVGLTDLRAAIESERISSPAAIVAAALALDARLIEWRDSLPPEWAYHSVSVDGYDPDVYDGYYDVYQDLWTAHFWNNHRCARVLLHQIVLSYSLPPALDSQQYLESRQVFVQMAAEMCASVPFHLGYPSVRSTTTKLPRAAGGYFLLWPLYLAGGMETNPAHRRWWIAERLSWIGRTTGIKQGETFAAVLRQLIATGHVEKT